MTVPVKIRNPDCLAYCQSCGSSHLGGDCGMSARDRYRSVRLSQDWMPAKRDGGLKNYYDDEALKATFGMDAKDRKEDLMEDTQGVGTVSREELRGPMGPVYAEHFLHTHPDWDDE